MRQTWAAPVMAPGCQPLAIGADGDGTDSRPVGPRGTCRPGVETAANDRPFPATMRPARSSAMAPGGNRSRRGGPMRNSPRSGSSRTGHRQTPDEPTEDVSRSPDASKIASQARPIGRVASSVPRARSQRSTPRSVHTASTRPSRRIDATPKRRGSPEGWARVRYSRAGSTSYVARSSSFADNNPSVPAEFRPDTAGQAQPRAGPGSDPRAAIGLPSRCWPAACRRGGTPHTGRHWSSLRGRPSDGRWRHPRGRSSNLHTPSPGWCRRVPRRPSLPRGQLDRPDQAAGLRLHDPAGEAGPLIMDRRDPGPVRAEGQAICRRSARPRTLPVARSPGRRRASSHRGGTGRFAGRPG